MPLVLRPALASDLPSVALMMNRAFRGTGRDAGWNSEAALIDGDRTSPGLLETELLANPEAVLLLAEVDPAKLHPGSPHRAVSPATTMLGCVRLEPINATTWYLGSLTIDPALQNTGLGRDLLHQAEQWAIARGAQTIRMTVVNRRDTLIAWYQRRGYQLTGEVQPFPYGDARFGTPRLPDLAFVVLQKAVQAQVESSAGISSREDPAGSRQVPVPDLRKT